MLDTATHQAANTADFTFRIGSTDADELKVVGFSGHEQISRMYEFQIDLCSDDEIELASVIGQPCRLAIAGSVERRFVHGIVRSFERTGEGRNAIYYRAEIVPVQWLLSKRHGCRIFQAHNCQDMTVPGIVQKVLEDAGIADDRFRFATHGSYEARDYVVQYREPESDFAARLLEDEGISYFFEHDADGYRMVFADGPTGHPTVAGIEGEAIDFREPAWLVDDKDRECIYGVRDRNNVQSGKVSLDDFNFRKPGLDLLSSANGSPFAALEFSDYPGGFDDKTDGGRYATLRNEGFACRTRVIEMVGGVRHLTAGCRFKLNNHPMEKMNGEYLVVSIRHQAVQPQGAEAEGASGERFDYQVQLEVIPADVPFRPAHVTPRPTVRGTQTAIVVGPEDEEIYTDKYGRVKCQFPWDREGQYDENSSCWIRVSQGMAGGGYGMMFLPRVGQEVIVDFLEGNPDKPIITGRVYNSDHMPAYSLPEEKSRSYIKTNSTKGGKGTNEICFQDLKGKEKLKLYAQRAMHMRSRGSTYQNVGHNHHLTVHKDKFELVKENKHSTVNLDHMETVKGNRYVTVEGDVDEVYGQHRHWVQGQYGMFAEEHVVIGANSGITLQCQGNTLTLDSAGIWLNGKHVGLNSGGVPFVVDDLEDWGAPDLPKNAAGAKPGHDTRYTPAGGDCPHAIDDDDPCKGDHDPTDDNVSWIEIEMVDELGRPWAGEAFEIDQPDGDTIRGTLDAKGRAHVGVRDPGTCQIRFPNLDADTWRRANV
jgi:type VI secretion system secreted protein VgrG